MTEANKSSILGGCFCGDVRYALRGRLVNARCCHCSKCRKVFSGAGSAYAEVDDASHFEWTSGADKLVRYSTMPGWELGFCGRCGSTICGLHNGNIHGVALGSVDGDPGVEIGMHVFVDSKAPWDHIGGSAPQFPAGPDSH